MTCRLDVTCLLLWESGQHKQGGKPMERRAGWPWPLTNCGNQCVTPRFLSISGTESGQTTKRHQRGIQTWQHLNPRGILFFFLASAYSFVNMYRTVPLLSWDHLTPKTSTPGPIRVPSQTFLAELLVCAWQYTPFPPLVRRKRGL